MDDSSKGATTHIYGLVDPRTGEVRYVGRANHPAQRMRAHIAEAPTTRNEKGAWLRSLVEEGMEPLVVILETVPKEEWVEAEKRWIDRFRAEGRNLTNVREGGGHIHKGGYAGRRVPAVPEEKVAQTRAAAEERVRPPIHPWRVLELEWLEPLGMSVNQLAKAIGVPRQRLNEVVRGKRAISADTALRLARWSGMRASFWLGLQARYDLEMSEWKDGERIEREVKPLATPGSRA